MTSRSNEAPPGLQYFIAEKNQVMIASYVGRLTHENREIFAKSQKDISESQAKYVILYFRDAGQELDKSLVPIFAQLQKIIRDKGIPFRLCSLHPELRRFLDSQGLLRPNEVTNNLVEALRSLNLATPMVG
jgi:anti-anti-sigma regulatory factor